MHSAGRSSLLRRPLITDHDYYYYMNMSSGDCSVKMGPAATRQTRETLGLLPEQRGGGFTGRSPRTGQSAVPTWRAREGGRTSRRGIALHPAPSRSAADLKVGVRAPRRRPAGAACA